MLAEIRARKPYSPLLDSEDEPTVNSSSILADNSTEKAIIEIECQRLVNLGGTAPPLWSETPKFAGMTRAARPERARPERKRSERKRSERERSEQERPERERPERERPERERPEKEALNKERKRKRDRSMTPGKGVSIDLTVRESPSKKGKTTRSGRVSKPNKKTAEAEVVAET